MYKLTKQGSSYNDSVHQYLCDTIDDMYAIPLSKNVSDSIGDKAYVIATSEKYVRNSEGQWKEDLSASGGIDEDTVLDAKIKITTFNPPETP